MKKVKISEATNLQLDWMVATAEGHSFVDVHGRGACRFPGVQTKNKRGGYELMPLRLQSTMKTAADADHPGVFFSGTQYWCPSINWTQGGPIIEREKIGFWFDPDEGWWATNNQPIDEAPAPKGPTPLIAAMRCYVSSKLGDEVEVPEELG